MSSMPTDIRIRFGGVVSGSLGWRRRRSHCDSTPKEFGPPNAYEPPSDVEWLTSRVAAQARCAASASPATSMASIAPNPG